MEKRDLVLEIGVEEIPSGYLEGVFRQLSRGAAVKKLFEGRGIMVDKIDSYYTPRRIILYIKDLHSHQDMVIEGPPKRIAFDADGRPTKAMSAFLERAKSAMEDIDIYNDGKQERVRVIKKDMPNRELLKEILPGVIKALYFPKTMYWRDEDIVFARPIRWILALFGSEVVDFSFGLIASSNITRGHRFLGRKRIRVRDAAGYFRALRRNHVLWDQRLRREKIASFLKRKKWHENTPLLNEVNALVEEPFFIEGRFREEYLALPREVLLASMSKHQRIFCLRDKKGGLGNRFVAVINGRYKGLKQMRGNFESVLDARLKDALFFYESDTRMELSKRADGLAGIIFHRQLGTVKDKVDRMKTIAVFLTTYIKMDSGDKKKLSRAILLCKADLLSSMVREFPSLQGIMGRYYAMASGEDAEVADAIGEHYLPRFADDAVPGTALGAISSLADKFDNIICYFKIGKFPKGNRDIYALRRSAIGIISILLKKKIRVSLCALFDYIYDIAPGEHDKARLKAVFLGFFKERFVWFVKERFNYRYDLLDAVVETGTDDPHNSFLKLEALSGIIDEAYFEKARCIVERTHNIIRSAKAAAKEIEPSLLREDEEKSLYHKYNDLEKEFGEFCLNREYQKATKLYADTLFDEIHNFFDKVLVNVSDKPLRSNRLGLLAAINMLYTGRIADLSKIVVAQPGQEKGGGC